MNFQQFLESEKIFLEILLNLKGIVFKSKTKDTQFGRLKVQGPSVVTADLIQLSDLEIINPNHYIATISTSNILEIEFKFEYGTGYKLADQTFLDEDENYLHLIQFLCQFKKSILK
jgi:DNA-directed RNA polymerase alpha subunit